MIAVFPRLGELLQDAASYNRSHFVYLPRSEKWTLDTQCAVLSESDVDGVPDVAREKGLHYAIGVAAIQDVVTNALSQIPRGANDQLLKAFLYYYDNDAFIGFTV